MTKLTFEQAKQMVAENYPTLLVRNTTKFSPKLLNQQRCQILSLAMDFGIKREVLAFVFGVHRATVQHIVSVAGKHYKDVRRERRELGDKAFAEKYFGTEGELEDLLAKCKEAEKDPEVKSSETMLEDTKAHFSPVANSRATKQAGHHKVFMKINSITAIIDVRWCSDEAEEPVTRDKQPPGWYVFFTDQNTAAAFNVSLDYRWGDGAKSRTSVTALESFLADTLGEILDD